MATRTDEGDVEVNFQGEEDYEHLIEDYSHLAPPTEGELLQGHVKGLLADPVRLEKLRS